MHASPFMNIVVGALLQIRVSATEATAYSFVDPRIIAAQQNTVPELGVVTKSTHNPLLSEEEPWDGNWLNSNPSVVYRDGVFHLWWTAKLVCPGASPGKCTRNGASAKVNPSDKCCHPGFNHSIPTSANASGGLLYASSTDGVNFVRPKLGLNELLGSTANNAVFVNPGGGASQVGVFFDESAGVYRAFGKAFPPSAGIEKGMGVASSHDGLHWENFTSAKQLDLNGDTSNNALWDPHTKRYLAFSRLDNHINYDLYGLRKETISSTSSWDQWSGHAVCLRGTQSGKLDGESYSLVPFRLPSFARGLYLGLGAFYDESSGIVTNELLRSTSFGQNWTRLAPNTAFIPHGKTTDNYTTYAARALLDPHDPSGKRLLMYYAGGDGPHSGRRRDYMMLATADASEMIGIAPADEASTATVETFPLKLGEGEGGRMAVKARFKSRSARVGVSLRRADGTVCASGEAEPADGTDDDGGDDDDDDDDDAIGEHLVRRVRSAAVQWTGQAPGCSGEALVSVVFTLTNASIFGIYFD
jgi:hypothetical protein